MTYNPIEYWNKRAVGYQAEYHGKDVLHLIQTLKNTAPKKVLEVGPGTGDIAKVIFDAELVHPLDYKMIDITTNFRPECIINTGISPLLYKDNIPFPENWFDFLISFSVLLHVPEHDLLQTLREYRRVCNKHIFIATYSPLEAPKELAPYNFAHDYEEAFKTAELAIDGEFRDGDRVCYLVRRD